MHTYSSVYDNLTEIAEIEIKNIQEAILFHKTIKLLIISTCHNYSNEHQTTFSDALLLRIQKEIQSAISKYKKDPNSNFPKTIIKF
jgi:hypothetical protein